MDEKSKSLQAQLQFMERNGRALEELIAKMLRVREEQESFFVGFARSMQDIGAQEDCKEIAQCLVSLGESSHKLAVETHDVMLQRPEAEMLLTLTQIQDWGVVPMKRLLEDREKALKIESKLQKEYDEKRGGSGKEKEKKLRMLSDQKRRVENANLLIEYHMRKFDELRLLKMKKIMSEMARSNMFYHAKGLELFSVPCAQISKLQIRVHGEIFLVLELLRDHFHHGDKEKRAARERQANAAAHALGGRVGEQPAEQDARGRHDREHADRREHAPSRHLVVQHLLRERERCERLVREHRDEDVPGGVARRADAHAFHDRVERQREEHDKREDRLGIHDVVHVRVHDLQVDELLVNVRSAGGRLVVLGVDIGGAGVAGASTVVSHRNGAGCHQWRALLDLVLQVVVRTAQFVLQRVRKHLHEQHEQEAAAKEEVGPLEAAFFGRAHPLGERLVLLCVGEQVQTRAREEDAARKHVKYARDQRLTLRVVVALVALTLVQQQQWSNAADERECPDEPRRKELEFRHVLEHFVALVGCGSLVANASHTRRRTSASADDGTRAEPTAEKIKLVVLGASGVGKTTLFRRLVGDHAICDEGGDGEGAPSATGFPRVVIEVWDVPSQLFAGKAMVERYLTGARGLVLVYSLESAHIEEQTWQFVREYLLHREQLHQDEENVAVVVVGNKRDLKTERTTTTATTASSSSSSIGAFCGERNVPHLEISARERAVEALHVVTKLLEKVLESGVFTD